MERKTAYFKQNTRISNFIQIPRSILAEDISISAKLIYGLLLARTMLSQKKRNRDNWTDEYGYIFIRYPIQQIAKDSGCSRSTVTKALKELKNKDLLQTERTGFNQANKIYLKYIAESSFQNGDVQIPVFRNAKTCYTEGQISVPRYTEEDKQKKDIITDQSYKRIHNFDERERTEKEWAELEEKLFNV